MYLRSKFEEEYDFFPVTFMLPYDFNAFKKEFIKKKLPEKDIDPPPIVEAKNTKSNFALATLPVKASETAGE